MSEKKIVFARRLGKTAFAGLGLAFLLFLLTAYGEMQFGPRHQMGGIRMLLFVLGLLVGVIGTPLYFLLLMCGWVDPAKKPVYFRRVNLTFRVSAITGLLAFGLFVISAVSAFSGGIGLIMIVVAIFSGIAALVFYLSGWTAAERPVTRSWSRIPRVGRRGANRAAKNDPAWDQHPVEDTPQGSSFLWRLGGVFVRLGKFLGYAAVPAALLGVVLMYDQLSSNDKGWMVLVGPMAFGFVLISCFIAAMVCRFLGAAMKKIAEKR